MKENYFFKSIGDEIKREGKNTDRPSLEFADHKIELGAMDLKDQWLTLRQFVQDKVSVVEGKEDEQNVENIKPLSELISPELMDRYREVVKILSNKSKVAEGHPHREFVDTNQKEISTIIDGWINELIDELKSKHEGQFNNEDIEEVRSQCWLFFESFACVMNTNAMENDIADLDKQRKSEKEEGTEEKSRHKETVIEYLQSHYPMERGDIEILLSVLESKKKGDSEYSFEILINTISKLWNEYKMGEKKGDIMKISLGYLLSTGIESFTPSLFQGILAHDKFNVAVFLEYFGLNKVSTLIDAKTEIELSKVMNDIEQQINRRITNSIFFQEFEFIHEKPLGEIYSTLERGKTATRDILEATISEFAPTLAGIAMSLFFLSRINPILGAIGVAGLPIMYTIARRQNKLLRPMYEKEKREGEKIATHLESVKRGFEEVKASPDTPNVAAHVRGLMDNRDSLYLQRHIEETKMHLKRMIPFDVSTVVAASVGGVLQSMGMISGGAILSNIMYTGHLNRPVQKMVSMYFNRFARYVQDIQRMYEIFGQYEELDLPEGEREKNRIPVTEVENFNISVRGLGFKNILRGINLDIRQGEFIAITGASGSGKSTLLRNMVGLYKPETGQINIGGVDADKIKKYGEGSIYSVMSYCNQDPQIFDEMTLRENLVLWSNESVGDDVLIEVLKNLHLDKFIGSLGEEVENLSGGERVRLGLARTLVKGAKIMLLDEPTASLDSQAATEVRKVISEIHNKYPETTIVCVSHDVDLVKECQREVNISELHVQP